MNKGTTTIPLRLKTEIYEEVKKIAVKDNRSMNNMTEELIKLGLNEFKKHTLNV